MNFMKSKYLLAALPVAAAAFFPFVSCDGGGEPGADASLAPEEPPEPPQNAPCPSVELVDLHPGAARYAPGSEVALIARVRSGYAETCTSDLSLTITDVGEVVHTVVQTVELPPQQQTTVALQWDPPNKDFHGYLAVLSATQGDRDLSTAVDVSSTPTRYPRYGYFSVFPPDQSPQAVRDLVLVLTQQYHLNMFQFYDWFWRHEDLILRDEDGEVEEEFVDLFGRRNDWATITGLVEAVHEQNALAMAYVAIYAAREGYEQISSVSPAWGLYETIDVEQQVALSFGDGRYLFLFDPSNPDWQEKMASEYVEAIETGAFDGAHIDQFGPRPTYYRADRTPVELDETFAPFLEHVDAVLAEAVPGSDLCIFNIVDGIVGGYGVEEVATTPACDVLYSEIWFANDTYETLRAYVEELRLLGRGRGVVLAVYPQYGEDVGTILQAESADLKGVTVHSAFGGFTGTGYAAEFDSPGDSIQWRIDLSEAAPISFVFRFANATGQQASRTVLVDGEPAGKVFMGPRTSWDEWSFDAWIQQILTEGEHTVTLTYAEDDTGTVNIDRLTLGEFDEDSVRLQNAVIFASGATPILVGDDEQSLSHEFFPNRSKSLRPSLKRALRKQFTFITAHERILFLPEVEVIEERLERVSATSNHSLITDGHEGIWTLLRRTPAGDAIHLVNLIGLDNDNWRDSSPTPVFQTDITLRYELEDPSAVEAVLWATPDDSIGAFSPLPFTSSDGFVEFTVPRLDYWDVILIRTGEPTD